MWPLNNKKTINKQSSPIVEACWKIRTRIEYVMSSEACQVLAVTSAGKSEGKTTTAVNLAFSYAQKNKKVLIIDANLRKPILHKIFDLSNSSGLTNVLNDRYEKKDLIQYTMIPNLFLLSSGANTVNPIELLTSNQMSAFLEKIKKEFDLIIIDTPPALDCSDAQIVSSLSDGVLLVIKDGKVKKEKAIKLKLMIEQVNAKIVGTVLNNVNRRKIAQY